VFKVRQKSAGEIKYNLIIGLLHKPGKAISNKYNTSFMFGEKKNLRPVKKLPTLPTLLVTNWYNDC